MNCKTIENLLISYIDHTLDADTQKSVQKHVENCQDCKTLLNEFTMLFDTMAQIPEEQPDEDLQLGFQNMLDREKAILKADKVKIIRLKKSIYQPVLQVAAAMILMLCSYFYGAYKDSATQIEEVTILEQEKIRMQELASMSLMENESASKRLQAVSFAKDLDHPNHKTLEVLIAKMRTDRHVNVRLAAANALAKFSDNTMVRSALVETLEIEDNANMQIELIQILVDIAERRAIPTMKKLLENSETPAYIKDQINSELKQII